MKPRSLCAFTLGLFLALISVLAAAGTAEALQFRLRWIDASKNEDGFKVERKHDNGKFVRIATLGPNVTSYVDSTVTPGGTYCYRVRAFNGKGSAASSPACATTGADLTIAKAGTGAGTVVSSPAGINCGSRCRANYPGHTKVTLSAVPAAGSLFAGWSGHKDCRNNKVRMDENIQCIAVFNKVAPGPAPNLAAAKNPASPVSVTQTASKPANQASAANHASGAKSGPAVSAASVGPTLMGVFRPSTGEWFLDKNGNGSLDGCKADGCVWLGEEGSVPVVGSWNGAAASSLGLFDPSTASWYLDLDGNGILDGCERDSCRRVYGSPGDVPLVGDWTGSGTMKIGVFRPGSGEWFFDVNGDGTFDGCVIDVCSRFFGAPGDLPVAGDWNGEGKTNIGVFRPATAEWLLDFSGDGAPESCAEQCLSFGAPGDLPVVGDWDGSGADKIGVFRPSTGEWFLDLNGDGNWDGCNVDACVGPFGRPGDLPVAGKWF